MFTCRFLPTATVDSAKVVNRSVNFSGEVTPSFHLITVTTR